VNTEICWEVLEYLHNWRFLKKSLAPWVSDIEKENVILRYKGLYLRHNMALHLFAVSPYIIFV
jgi:hypothetical protein